MSNKQKKNKLDLYLTEVFNHFIALKDNDVKRSQEVFKSVFEQVKDAMGEQCNYFANYSSQVMYGGSVYDGIKVSKLDEFDMDIVIRLPISYEDGENGITIENEQPGFVKLKITKAFDNLVTQSNWELCHKVTHTWRDNDSYLRQDMFRNWIHSIVQKAMNDLHNKVTVNGVTYSLSYKKSGPAYTLKIASLPDNKDEPFKLDVDLVPVIRFTHPRWPQGYRQPNVTTAKDWLVVPKPNKAIKDGQLQNRCWRLSFQDFEKELMKGCQNLKTTIRLVKKMRDVLEMKAIASYYIKTLFLWKISQNDKKYWETKVSALFKTMVGELHKAIQDKNIPYFWNEDNNLIESLNDHLQRDYTQKLQNVLDGIDSADMDKVLIALLTTGELTLFKRFDFYQKSISSIRLPRRSQKLTVDADLVNNLESKMLELTTKLKELTEKMNNMNTNEDEYPEVVQEVKEISDEIEDYKSMLPVEPKRGGTLKKILLFLAFLPLIKKMRDVLKLKKIVTHYIKTLFLWKISKTSKSYWDERLSVLFKTMVQELYNALNEKYIPCFWHRDHNLIANLKETERFKYIIKLKDLLHDIDTEDADKVLIALLTSNELSEFRKLDIYKQQSITTSITKEKPTSCIHEELVMSMHNQMDTLMKNVDELSETLNGKRIKINVAGSIKRISSNVTQEVDTTDSSDDSDASNDDHGNLCVVI